MRTYMLAPLLGAPRPAHAQTKAAKLARQAVAAYAAERAATRRAALAEVKVAQQAADAASRLDLDDLTAGPKRVMARLLDVGAQVAATRSADGQRLSVWAVTRDGHRVRALYRRSATGWLSDGVIVDGRAEKVTAALVALESGHA